MEYNSFLINVFCSIVVSKARFAKFSPFLAEKCFFASNPVMEYNSSLKTLFCSIVGWKRRFAKN